MIKQECERKKKKGIIIIFTLSWRTSNIYLKISHYIKSAGLILTLEIDSYLHKQQNKNSRENHHHVLQENIKLNLN